MAGATILRSFHIIGILTCITVFGCVHASAAQDFPLFAMFQKVQPRGDTGLVRVTINTTYEISPDALAINGTIPNGHGPIVVQESFSSTGIVLDDKGNVMTFLGYRWLDFQSQDASIEISQGRRKYKGKLVGIDQRNGVAVIRADGSKLVRTAICRECKLKDGTTVMTPVSPETSRFRQTQVVSVADGPSLPEPRGWITTMEHPFPEIGLPILTADHRVLGFVASQDALGLRNEIYPVSRLLESAEKILKTGGDIFAGWLGLYLADSDPAAGRGVLVNAIEPGSPAQSAGLAAGDLLFKFNGHRVENSGHFIRLVEQSPIGSKADIEIVRQGNPLKIKALIGARKFQPDRARFSFNFPAAFGFPVPAAVSQPASRNQSLLIGVETLYIEPELAGGLQLPVQHGLLVVDVVKGTPAERAGILVGDIILSIDKEPIADPLAFARFMQTHQWGSQVLVEVNRKGAALTVPVHIATTSK